MSKRPPAFCLPLTACLEPLYRLGVGLRNKGYETGFKNSHRAHVPVISVGNLTAGGTGKTPTVIRLSQWLQEAGHHPAIILRGYASENGQSDEQNLLSQSLEHVPVVANPDRVAAAVALKQQQPKVDVIVLDDGFQHRRIQRDFDLVLLDATDPFGGGHLLPRGLLREPAKNLKRAGAVLVTRCDRVDEATLEQIDRKVESLTGSKPVAHAHHHWDHWLDETNQKIEPDGPVLAVCGIGNPEAFFAQARQCLTVAGTIALADHHRYRDADLRRFADEVKRLGARALLTTEKDWVKLGPLVQSAQLPLKIWRPVLSLGFRDGDERLKARVLETAGRNQTT